MPFKKCLDCGEEFYTKSTRLRCVKCAPIHKKKLMDLANKRNYAKYRVDPEQKRKTNERAKAYYKTHKDYYKEYQKRYYLEVTKVKKKFPISYLELDGNKITLYECPKLHFKATNLPCGDRFECWLEPKCKHIPKDKTPVTFSDVTTEKSWWQQSKIKPNFGEIE